MNSIWLIFILFATVLLGAGGLIFFTLTRKKAGTSSESFLMLQQQLNHISQILDSKLTESNQEFRTQFTQNTAIVKDAIERLTRLDETNKQVINFAEQLQSLEDILKNPKQ